MIARTSNELAPDDGSASERRRKFFQAAEPLLVRYGYRKTTVEEICRAAGASKRTFYELFKDKADLVARLTMHAADEIVDRWRATSSPDKAAARQLDDFIEAYFDLARQRQIFRMVLSDQDILLAFGSLSEEWKVWPTFLVLREILKLGIQRGEFRPVNPEIETEMIYTFLDTTSFLVPRITGQPGPLEEPALAAEVKAFILNGLRNPS
ncbi:TetR/AcrR family transcriptional regulator [bacterium]|nr:TetR/AcrR family transcriptional regulator [bacterium]MBU1984872.1 TetR/AcrR family transcriptional regulator [bacterium]